jgi:3-phosphoshikimate 1-carboxyvinyltransferase
MLIAAALSDGICRLTNCLESEDTLLTRKALRQMGVRIDADSDSLLVHGTGGVLDKCDKPLYLANSGTSMRLLTSVAALGKGRYRLTGTQRMCERPIQDLLNALNSIGVNAYSVSKNGCPPIEVEGGIIKGGELSINCGISSQFLSSLLLIAPYTRQGLDITVSKGPVSRPYLDMTVDVMTLLGINVEREAYHNFKIEGGRKYGSGDYAVEPDCSQAGYFWAAAAVSGATIKVKGINKASRQGDVRFAEVLEAMGCKVVYEDDGIRVTGGNLKAVEADMADMPDIVPTLAVTAAFAEGVTRITNVAHLKAKESDRLAAVATELNKMGIEASATDSGLIIKGGVPEGAEIETYNDHRIAMSFAIAGLKTPGLFIKDEKCVEKSFPNFWEVFRELYRR